MTNEDAPVASGEVVETGEAVHFHVLTTSIRALPATACAWMCLLDFGAARGEHSSNT
mgnify:FL=1